MVLPTALVLLLCNIDRICMSVAILPLAKEMSWAPSIQASKLQQAAVLSVSWLTCTTQNCMCY